MASYKLTHPRSKTTVTVSTASRRDALLARGFTEAAPAPKPKATKAKKAKK